MRTTQFKVLEEVSLNNPIFIEALPGLGHVGKLAADHMIDELGATKFAEIYSPTFPPQVLVKDEGIIENMFNELYYLRDVGEDNLDLILLVGNTQSLSPEGQYLVCKEILEFVKGYDIDRIYTLGGMVTGPNVENPKVFGAATDEACIELLKEAGVVDSGGQGLMQVLKGAFDAFLGKEIDLSMDIAPSSKVAMSDVEVEEVDIKFGYCTELTTAIFESEISVNGLGLGYSKKLDKASITSAMTKLSDTTSGLRIYLSLSAVNKAFETSVGSNDGSSSTEWGKLVDAKPNWDVFLQDINV